MKLPHVIKNKARGKHSVLQALKRLLATTFKEVSLLHNSVDKFVDI